MPYPTAAMGTGFSAADRQTLAVPDTVPIPAGRLDLRESDGSARTVEIPSFLIGRMPVINREYAPFLAAGRAQAPPWWTDPDFSAPGQPVVGVTWDDAAAFCAWLCGDRGRALAPAHGAGVGARGERRAHTSAHRLGREDPSRRDPRGSDRRPLGGRPRDAQRLRSLRRRHDRSRVVRQLARARPCRWRASGRIACPPGEPRRLLAPRDPLVRAVGAHESAARLPLLRLRIPRAPRGLVTPAGLRCRASARERDRGPR